MSPHTSDQPSPAFSVTTETPEDTLRLGADIAMAIHTGDLLLLSGDLGAGKSLLARGIIQHLAQDETLEVASPTFTLCNVYETRLMVSHFDLYRLGEPEEVEELGIEEAAETGCALVEWPEKAVGFLPDGGVFLKIIETGEFSRRFEFSGDENAIFRIKRSLDIRRFLDESGYQNAVRAPLTGDASARRYETVEAKDETWLLMDSPALPDGPVIRDNKSYSQIAHLAEDVKPFIAIAKLLRKKGFAAPEIPAEDMEAGLLLVEYLGGDGILDEKGHPIAERYQTAIEFLNHLHGQKIEKQVPIEDDVMHSIPCFDVETLLAEVELLPVWYVPYKTGKLLSKAKEEEFFEIWRGLHARLDDQNPALILRDFHSPNIIWRGGAEDTQRIGLIDFQDALLGSPAYDVASLAQDARVDVSPELESALLDHYIALGKERTGFDEKAFARDYAIMAAQRATKILGIFVRLNQRDGKPAYLKHIPRMEDYISRSLKHPVLKPYKDWLATVIEL